MYSVTESGGAVADPLPQRHGAAELRRQSRSIHNLGFGRGWEFGTDWVRGPAVTYSQRCPRCGHDVTGDEREAVADAVVEHARVEDRYALDREIVLAHLVGVHPYPSAVTAANVGVRTKSDDHSWSKLWGSAMTDSRPRRLVHAESNQYTYSNQPS
jgi:hypothetical protein